MIRHVVAWSLATEDPAEKAAQIEQIRAGLTGLTAFVPELLRIEVVENVAADARNSDLAVDADFADLAGLEAYIVHPEHQKVAGFINSVVSSRWAIDWEV